MGVKETQDKKIRQFAEKIIPQHEALIKQLRQFSDAPPLGYHRNSQREENQQADQVVRQQAGEPQQAAQAQRPATAPFGQTQTGQVEQQPGGTGSMACRMRRLRLKLRGASSVHWRRNWLPNAENTAKWPLSARW